MEQMTSPRRALRVEKELRNIIGNYINIHLKEQLTGIVTIANIIVSNDLRNAKVLLSFFNSGEDLKDDFAVINHDAKAMQGLVARRIRMKFCPKIKFYIDTGFEKSEKIHQILNSLENQSQH